MVKRIEKSIIGLRWVIPLEYRLHQVKIQIGIPY